MGALTVSQLLGIARQHLEAGRRRECEELCRQILANKDAQENAVALGLLANLLEERGQVEAAVAYGQRAIAADPGCGELHRNLGRMLGRLERWEEAAERFERAVGLMPEDFDGLLGWGRALLELWDFAGAERALRRAMEIRPGSVEAIEQMSEVLRRAGRFNEAAEMCRRAIAQGAQGAAIWMRFGAALADAGRDEEARTALQKAASEAPGNAEAAGALGDFLRERGEAEEAVEWLRKAVELDASARRWVRLGNALLDAGRDEEATEAFGEALAKQPQDVKLLLEIGTRGRQKRGAPAIAGGRRAGLELLIATCTREIKRHPNNPAIWFGLGVGYQGKRHIDAAIDAYRKTVQLQPEHTEAINNLALAVKDQGNMEEAIALLRRAADLRPGFAESLSNVLYAIHFDPKIDASTLVREHQRWEQTYGVPLRRTIQPHPNDPDPERRLRVGYVSPNFSEHPVGRFLAAFFPQIVRGNMDTYCYASVRSPDAVTERLRACADHWRNCSRIPDAELAKRIREDRIDILIDLDMHMAQSRLLTFARQPAPVQITYLAYCSTTGLSAMDYRLTDPYLDPPDRLGAAEFVERPLHLSETYWCYAPGIDTDEPDPTPPSASKGFITFGCFNNFCKVSPAAKTAWAKIMQAMPDSRLILHAHRGSHRDRFHQEFKRHGISPERITFIDFLDLAPYLELHRSIDIALDTFPYPGGTTTCDALWMGVPTVSLAGDAPFMRAGLSILSNIGLADLAAFSEEEYVQKTIALAKNPDRLAELRRTLRRRMLESPLMNPRRFAINLENCYRQAWRNWCAERTAAK